MYAGKVTWQQQQPPGLHGTAPVLSIPDLDSDMVKDLALVASDNTQVNMAANLGPNTSGKTKWLHLNISSHVQTQLVFLSGKTGVLFGSKVVLNSMETAHHLLHHSTTGSQYVLLQTGLCPKTASHDLSIQTDAQGHLDTLLFPDTSASASSQKRGCTAWLCGRSLPKPNQGWRWTSKWTNSGRRMPVQHLGLYPSMSKPHIAHICLAIIAPFNKNWLLAQIGLLETRAESGTRRGNPQPAASHWTGGGTPEWENIAITVEVQYQLSPQVFFSFCVRYHLIWLQYLMCCSVNGASQILKRYFFMQGTLFWTL